ncbi:hypothetical protein GCM10011348_28540 [Marinobacterium nitratireducens]|uniref:Uncharacterized protein n=1 Tax=Marinobacterium nitratireducens TaxID=518897 RepID=A0A917ZJ94_9GAMM|nr:hypothetical protein [Marinobacterium nitratireducens]GGO83813.1 hypothetical protein GCM10011348_28540 [Marinobacterium nitratireducens]
MDWDSYFAKAKKATTLERMLLSKVEQMGIRYNPGSESLRLVADFYKDSYPSAYQMLMAAHKREQALEATPPAAQRANSITNSATSMQKGLEDEIQAWMAHHRKANA